MRINVTANFLRRATITLSPGMFGGRRIELTSLRPLMLKYLSRLHHKYKFIWLFIALHLPLLLVFKTMHSLTLYHLWITPSIGKCTCLLRGTKLVINQAPKQHQILSCTHCADILLRTASSVFLQVCWRTYKDLFFVYCT